ncbi:MAG: hypothetical protein DRJ50_03010 [Actinobacteria bacterium]|nr:MAG: hypothetical protein DRJ50_03010 [Actinomycetota bacterium]
MDPTTTRSLWHQLETINAVAYFTDECRAAATELGLKGFWMGYFACRAAPMGAVPAGVCEATFFNFHPSRVQRAIPEAWVLADPADVVVARSIAATAALRRLLPDGKAELLANSVLPALRATIGVADPAGRPLFGANRDVLVPDDPVAALWQAATTLREHRGDGHVALLTSAGLDGCEVHVLFAAGQGIDPLLFQQSRGWSPDDWAAATERLAARDLITVEGSLTETGRHLREKIEDHTDTLAGAPYAALGEPALAELLDLLGPAADRIAASGDLTFPNPMGLPDPRA